MQIRHERIKRLMLHGLPLPGVPHRLNRDIIRHHRLKRERMLACDACEHHAHGVGDRKAHGCQHDGRFFFQTLVNAGADDVHP